MRYWLRSLVLPCGLLALGFGGCSDDAKSGSGSGGSSTSDGSGGTHSDNTSTSTDSGGTESDATSSGGSQSTSSGSGGTGGTLSEQTGSSCETADDCYPQIADGELAGEALCLDRIEGGYCTHECEQDTDCCSVEGECDDAFAQVCSPFENTGLMLCFLSCEEEDISGGAAGASGLSADDFCRANAGDGFICRSTGGGADNRRVCVPAPPPDGEGGAAGAAGAGGQTG